MKPLKVEFQAFGPYAGHETVDFEAISAKGVFLICGKTGIGKTMILDAMTFALYGKSSGHGRDDFESMRCTNAEFSQETFVRFEFENRGEYYCFERRLERKRKNLSASYNVSQKDDDGVFYPLMENPKEKAVNEKAVEIIGLQYEQFRQVIVLPQGQFERLLTSNSDEKEKILTTIFGEEKWQVIAERFYEKAECRKNELKEVQERMKNRLSEEGCESVLQLEAALQKKQEEKALLEKTNKEADYDRIIKEQQNILAIARRFGDLHKAEDKEKELAARQEERAEQEKILLDARRADKVRILMEEMRRSEEALSGRKKEEEAAVKTAEEKKNAFEKASEALREHAQKEKDIEILKGKKLQYEGKRGDYEGLLEAEKELSGKKKEAEKALEEETKAKEKSDAFAEKIVALQKEYSALQAEHEESLNGYLAGITGELASHLTDGSPCPVCGSTEHPHKAHAAKSSITKAAVDAKKKAAEQKYQQLQEKLEEQETVRKLAGEKHAAVEKANTEVAALSAGLEGRRKNLVPGIASGRDLEIEIEKLQNAVTEYEDEKKRLTDLEKKAADAFTEAKTRIGTAKKETEDAKTAQEEAAKALKQGLAGNGFASLEEAEKRMLTQEETEALSSRIASFDANLAAARGNLASLKEELAGKQEPDEKACLMALDAANNAVGEFREKNAVLSGEIDRLGKKAAEIRAEGEGMEEKLREAEEDFAFAKRLRGDSGTGLQRYVLGIMFSSVIAAANRMLSMVHGGRYRLYRSDEKAPGTNKRGLELKVFDKNSGEREGRFVSTLSGGEKFLASLALSIGMSTVAQKSGIRIEALFIDEGFGSLDEESISDAMNILGSLQEANGLVGIISHVQLLQDQIPTKLRIEQDERGSHIVQTVG